MKKRIIALLLAAAMILALAACSGGTSGTSGSGSSSTSQSGGGTSEAKPDATEDETPSTEEGGSDLPFSPDNPIELTAAVSQSEIQGDFDTMEVLANYAEKTGIHITFQEIPASDRAEQLSLMLSSGEVPDILFKMSVGNADQARYAAEELFVPLSDYPDLMTNLQRWFDEYPTAKDAVTMEDGKIYGAPYILAGDAIRAGSKLWYNSDLLEQTGYSTPPKTTEEFYDYLKKCKEIDNNGNGEADEIPLTSASIDEIETVLYGSFGLMTQGSSHGNIYLDDDGTLQFNFTSDRYKEELAYLHQLYTEGLIDQDIFTMDYAQEIAKCTTGRGENFMMVNNSPVANSSFEATSLGFKEPFEGPSGFKKFNSFSMPASEAAQFMITYKCADKGEDAVKAAMTWMDHWYSDEGIIEYFLGIEGVTYQADETAPGGLAYTDLVLNDPDGRTFEQVLTAYVPWAGGANPSVATNEFFKGGETWPCCLEAIEGLRNYFPDDVWAPFTRYYTADDATEMNQINTDMTTYRKEWRGYFITGQKDLEADWDEYVAGYTGVKLERYMEIYNKGYEGFKADNP